jgi:peroxisomal enoyl-CoA hydratase 2
VSKKVVGIRDTGKGLIVDEEESLLGPDGSVYASMIVSLLNSGKWGVLH